MVVNGGEWCPSFWFSECFCQASLPEAASITPSCVPLLLDRCHLWVGAFDGLQLLDPAHSNQSLTAQSVR